MTVLHFTPIKGRTEEIVQNILDAPEIHEHPEHEFAFHLAFEEIVSNIVCYAYSPEAEGEMTIEIVESDQQVIITFKDRGKPFDPLSVAEPDTTLSINERPVGGLGIFLVRKMMDSVSYIYSDSQNILEIRKKYSQHI